MLLLQPQAPLGLCGGQATWLSICCAHTTTTHSEASLGPLGHMELLEFRKLNSEHTLGSCTHSSIGVWGDWRFYLYTCLLHTHTMYTGQVCPETSEVPGEGWRPHVPIRRGLCPKDCRRP